MPAGRGAGRRNPRGVGGEVHAGKLRGVLLIDAARPVQRRDRTPAQRAAVVAERIAEIGRAPDFVAVERAGREHERRECSRAEVARVVRSNRRGPVLPRAEIEGCRARFAPARVDGIERIPAGLVLAERHGCIQRANRAGRDAHACHGGRIFRRVGHVRLIDIGIDAEHRRLGDPRAVRYARGARHGLDDALGIHVVQPLLVRVVGPRVEIDVVAELVASVDERAEVFARLLAPLPVFLVECDVARIAVGEQLPPIGFAAVDVVVLQQVGADVDESFVAQRQAGPAVHRARESPAVAVLPDVGDDLAAGRRVFQHDVDDTRDRIGAILRGRAVA